ncbi:hypothetical protein CV102_21515 [Natronococcus pandeyae]|uniref:LVIVD repeat-containing protein n=2 Tax=Natronococcus pandeyae TaxID=2055836 RepID=A0A8J8PZH4_9EURY|nr:hypothetical protein CV102_21515 [Natronococcus pandeyae]
MVMVNKRGAVRRRTVLKTIGAVGAIGSASGVASASGSGGRSPGLELVGHSTLGARDGANTHAAVNEDLDLAAVGSFVSVDPEVRIVDISDPTDPEMTAVIETGFGNDIRNTDIHPDEPLIFTANEGSGEGNWAIVDADDKHNPELIGNYTVDGADSGTHNVQAYTHGDDDYLITCGHGRGFVVFDINDPEEPEEVYHFHEEPHTVHAAHVQGDYAYLAHWGAGLWIIELGDLSDPEVVGSFDYREEEADVPLRACHHTVPHPTEDLCLVGEEVGGRDPGYKHIVEFDLETGETELLSSFQFPQHAPQPTGTQSFWWTGHFSDWGVGDQEDVVFSGDYKAGVQAFDLSDPEDPVRISQYMPTEGVGEVRREDPDRLDLLDNVPFAWGAESQLAGDSGRVYVADATTGFYVLELEGY